ncbi:MAG: type II secretion system protein GspE, partial [bacterium]
EGLRRLGLSPEDVEGVTFYRGRGCEYCRHTGYYGRTGIFELMVVNEEIAELIVRRAPLSEIREAAKAAGMKTLMEDGLRKAMAGITTIEEVLRVAATIGY